MYACNPDGAGCGGTLNITVEVKVVPVADMPAFLTRSDVSVMLGGSYSIAWGGVENLISRGTIRLDRRLSTCSGATSSCWSNVAVATEAGSLSFTDPAGTYVYSVYACNPVAVL